LTLHHHRGSTRAAPGRVSDIAVSVLIVALVVAAWVYFS
jgi:hypothetical protein